MVLLRHDEQWGSRGIDFLARDGRWWGLSGLSSPRRSGLVAVVVLAALLAAGAVGFGVWATVTGNSAVFGHLTALAGVFSLVLAAMIAAVGMVAWAWRAGAMQQGDMVEVPELDRLADVLAGAVKVQWTTEAAERGLLEPEPIPVRWRKPSLPFVGPVSAAVGSQRFAPLPGLPAVSQQRLRAGKIRDLHAVYGGLGSGRLVVAGAPGSGKSGGAVLLVLAALKHREQVPDEDRPRVPVPVMVTPHGWDPNTQRAQDWLAGRLQQTYVPLFAGKSGAEKATELLAAGKVAVFLDGLDEIPEVLRPVALRALSQAAFRVVVLTRSTEMAAAATQGHLEGAAALELEDIAPVTAADYLTRVQLDPPPRGWRELTDYLRYTPDSPIAQALNSPLTLTLVRDTYRGGDDIRELLEFCGAADHHICRDDIVDHLLDRVLPTAYEQRPGDPPVKYDLPTAQRALGCIATRMNEDGTRDLQWWRIPMWAPVAPRVIATGLLPGLATGLVFGLVAGLTARPGAGLTLGLTSLFVIGLVAGLAPGRGRRSPQRIAPMRWRRVSWRSIFPRLPRLPRSPPLPTFPPSPPFPFTVRFLARGRVYRSDLTVSPLSGNSRSNSRVPFRVPARIRVRPREGLLPAGCCQHQSLESAYLVA